jgi:Na+/H+ antiporter NhaD/arsenite permease-like protein
LSLNLFEFSELFLFLLSAMTYVNAMDERLVFEALRSWLVRKGFGYRSLFWLTGGIAFALSPLPDNLTASLIMCAVLLAVGKDKANSSPPGASISSLPPTPAGHFRLSETSPRSWYGRGAGRV